MAGIGASVDASGRLKVTGDGAAPLPVSQTAAQAATSPQSTSSVVTTGAVVIKASAGRYYGFINSGAAGTNASAINITDGVAGTVLDVIPANCPAGTQHYFAGGIPFATSLNEPGLAGGPTITVYFQ